MATTAIGRLSNAVRYYAAPLVFLLGGVVALHPVDKLIGRVVVVAIMSAFVVALLVVYFLNGARPKHQPFGAHRIPPQVGLGLLVFGLLVYQITVSNWPLSIRLAVYFLAAVVEGLGLRNIRDAAMEQENFQ